MTSARHRPRSDTYNRLSHESPTYCSQSKTNESLRNKPFTRPRILTKPSNSYSMSYYCIDSSNIKAYYIKLSLLRSLDKNTSNLYKMFCCLRYNKQYFNLWGMGFTPNNRRGLFSLLPIFLNK